MGKVFDYIKSAGTDPVLRLEAELEYTASHLTAALDESQRLRAALIVVQAWVKDGDGWDEWQHYLAIIDTALAQTAAPQSKTD